MSRSYKKNPVVTCCKNPKGKREANKKVRKSNNIPNGRGFKKLYCSWKICDYKSRIKDILKYDKNEIRKWMKK